MLVPEKCNDTWLEARINWYTSDKIEGETLVEMERYQKYTELLSVILNYVKRESSPLGIVAARKKDPASYAEKCIRKFDKFKADPAYQFTDLCGGRLVVHTLAELDEASRLLRKILKITQEDDTRTRLSPNEFGYRSVHFDIEIDPELLPDEILDNNRDLIAAVNGPGSDGQPIRRRAEVQVRTLLQHAWSDVLHDRLYKTHLVLPGVYRRQAAALAARLEDLDDDFLSLAESVDAYEIDYGAYMTDAKKEQRLKALKLLLEQPSIEFKRKQKFALESVRLYRALGDWKGILPLAREFAGDHDNRDLLLLGATAACRTSLDTDGKIVDRLTFLDAERQVRELVQCPHDKDEKDCLNCKARTPFRSQALGVAAWCILRRREGDFYTDALSLFRSASNCDPRSPYMLRKMIECEALNQRRCDFVHIMVPRLEEAVERCREHIEVRTELPAAYFTAGSLLLFLGRDSDGISLFCQGLLESTDLGLIREELQVADDLSSHLSGRPAESFKVLSLLLNAYLLKAEINNNAREADTDEFWSAIEGSLGRSVPVLEFSSAAGDILIVAGGARSFEEGDAVKFRDDMTFAMQGWSGTIISGGTRCGVPGIVGDVIEALGSEKIDSIAMCPEMLPADVPVDERYKRVVITNPGHGFSVLDAVFYWLCLLRAGIELERVKLIGAGGGAISYLEYWLALVMGASVGIRKMSGGAADRFLSTFNGRLDVVPLALPADAATCRAFIFSTVTPWRFEEFDGAARFAHEAYCSAKVATDKQLKPWDELDETYKVSNCDQVVYAAEILASEGLSLNKSSEPKVVNLKELLDNDAITRMAALEHGRWNVERLRQKWQYAKKTDRANKLHSDLVRWEELSASVREWDVKAVLAFPAALAASGFEIVKNG